METAFKKLLASTRIPAWLFAVLLCVLFFSFTPKQKPISCVEEIFVNQIFRFSYNCDSKNLTNMSQRLTTFYTEFHNWKGRPVYFNLGLVTGYAMTIPTTLVKPFLNFESRSRSGVEKVVKENLQFYAAYFLINIIVLVTACWISVRLSGFEVGGFAAFGLALAVASTDIVEAGVFLLHTNIMNLLVATGAAFYVVLGVQRQIFGRLQYFILPLLIGLGILVYPAFIILAPAFACGMVFALLREGNLSMSKVVEASLTLAAFFALAALPAILWAQLNSSIFGTDTYLTLDKGQFKWLPLAIQEGRLLETFPEKLLGFFLSVWGSAALELTLGFVAISVVLGVGLRRGRLSADKILDPVVFACLIAILGVLSFNFLQGYWAPRLHYSVVVLVYLFVARLAWLLGGQRVAAHLLSVIALIQLADAALNYSVTGG